jgi:hypothetical protein
LLCDAVFKLSKPTVYAWSHYTELNCQDQFVAVVV